jgi:Na+-translocating ferredoxin:NAD+ oxidoreductase RnfD subunit
MVSKALKNMKSNCVSLKILLNSIYILKQLKYLWNIPIEFVLIFRVLFWLAQQR